MIKSNLPVILLKGLVLLPFQEARIELNNDISKKVINLSEKFHNNELLIVSPINKLEEKPSLDDLPSIGVIGEIKSKIDLPNGITRVVILGKKRVKIYSYVNYSNEKDVLESIVANIPKIETDEIEETALLRKLIKELDKYISMTPFISNSILSQIKGITDLDKLTDKIANFLPLSFDKKIVYMVNPNYMLRAKKLITELNIEMAVISLENKLETELKQKLEDTQKEFILKEKLKLIKEELGEEDSKSSTIKVIKEKIKSTKMPLYIHERLEKELNRYSLTPEITPELGVIRNYIDILLMIPWNKSTKDELDLDKIKSKLDKTHYGLTEVKERIIEYIAVKNNNKDFKGSVICLVGPPGVGKTTLGESIATSLNRKFEKISLGGLSDANELIGHRKTYIGSAPGKVIKALIKSKSNNPVILLDEIDKLNKDFRSDPEGVLLDILDNKQNKTFVDNYIEEEVDLSNVFFICTANDLTTISVALKDRLEIIDIDGYTMNEKINICKNHLIPDALLNAGVKESVKFTENVIVKIIEEYTKESGVRELNRLVNKIIRKIITESKKEKKKINKNILISDIPKYLKSPKYIKRKKASYPFGYSKGVAYTIYGGDIIEAEITSYNGEEKVIATGSLGKIMEESINIAISYIKSNLKNFSLDENIFKKKTIHINFRETAVPKEGPSAGTLIVTVLLSYFKKIKIPENISMTGEITLNGDVLPIGGLKEKSLAAIRNDIDTLYIPFDNKNDMTSLEEEIKEKIKFKTIKNYEQIYKDLFKNK